MALTDKSLFLYGITVGTTNYYLPFKAASGGPEIDAVIPANQYTLTSLAAAIATAMNQADTANTYTVTVNRTLSNNLQNAFTISTSGIYLSLLFGSSSLVSLSIATTIGFTASDKTGSTSYTSASTSGTALQTTWYGFNYQPPSVNLKTIGSVNLAANGTKEVVYWSVQQFIKVEFRYEVQANVLAYWQPMIAWMVTGGCFEFTPETKTPSTNYSCTLESPGGGLELMMKEMIPDFPFVYTTGPLEFRLLAGTY